MPIPIHTITCIRKEEIAPAVYEIACTKPNGFTFVPGQFVLFDVPLADNPHDIQPRAYSIASSPREDNLLFVIKLVEGGRASGWIERFINEGVPVKMKGPFGAFTINRKTGKPYLFIATGTGVGPFRSQLKWLLEEEEEKRDMQLVFGVRANEDFFWIDQLKALEERHPNCKIHTSTTKGGSDWHGHAGRVQDIVPQIITDFSNINVYICGAPDMVKEVKKLCIDQWEIPKADVHIEGYI